MPQGVSRQAFRRRLILIDWMAKKHKWRSVAVVGCRDAELVKFLLDRCKMIARLIAVPKWDEGRHLSVAEAARQAIARRTLERLDAQRAAFQLEAEEYFLDAVAPTAVFDAVVLIDVEEENELAEAGRLWAPRVVDGGWLVGVDHRRPAIRGVLDAVAPEWRGMIEGVWGVQVVRGQVDRQIDGGAVEQESAAIGEVDDLGPRLRGGEDHRPDDAAADRVAELGAHDVSDSLPPHPGQDIAVEPPQGGEVEAVVSSHDASPVVATTEVVPQPVKRKRGRPRKQPPEAA